VLYECRTMTVHNDRRSQTAAIDAPTELCH
jgi:hypothetical protein